MSVLNLGSLVLCLPLSRGAQGGWGAVHTSSAQFPFRICFPLLFFFSGRSLRDASLLSAQTDQRTPVRRHCKPRPCHPAPLCPTRWTEHLFGPVPAQSGAHSHLLSEHSGKTETGRGVEGALFVFYFFYLMVPLDLICGLLLEFLNLMVPLDLICGLLLEFFNPRVVGFIAVCLTAD